MITHFIPLEPLQSQGRALDTPALLYSVQPKNSCKNERLRIYIRKDLAAQMQLKRGDCLRLEGDLTAGLARLVRVSTSADLATREVDVRKSGSAVWLIRRSGVVADTFPFLGKGKTEELTNARVAEEGLVFQLPGRGFGAPVVDPAGVPGSVVAPLTDLTVPADSQPAAVALPKPAPAAAAAVGQQLQTPRPAAPVTRATGEVPAPVVAPAVGGGRGGVWGASKLVQPEKGEWCESAFHTRAHYVVQGVALCGERVPDGTRWRGLKHGGKRCAVCLAASGD